METFVEAVQNQRNQRILDAGCGTGYWSLQIAKKLDSSNLILALDIDPELITGLNKELQNQGWPQNGSANIRATVGDLRTAELSKENLTTILCRHSLHHIVRPKAVISNLLKALNMAGSLYIIEIEAPENTILNNFINRAASLSNSQNVKYYTCREMIEMLNFCGFNTEILCQSQDFVMRLRDYRRRWSDNSDFERLKVLSNLLLNANEEIRQYFKISGKDLNDQSLTLPEVVIRVSRRA